MKGILLIRHHDNFVFRRTARIAITRLRRDLSNIKFNYDNERDIFEKINFWFGIFLKYHILQEIFDHIYDEIHLK